MGNDSSKPKKNFIYKSGNEAKIKRYLKLVDCDTYASRHLAHMLDYYLRQQNYTDYERASMIENNRHASFARNGYIFVLKHHKTPCINVYFCPDEKLVLFGTRNL